MVAHRSALPTRAEAHAFVYLEADRRDGTESGLVRVRVVSAVHRSHRRGTMSAVSEALKNFPHLPPDAVVRLPIVAALYGVSAPTVWRWSKAGRLPAPIKRGGVTAWRVGDLRAAMARAA